MAKVISVKAREVFDSRLTPTVEATVRTYDGKFRAMVPSGASTGSHEAFELRDGDRSRANGKGVLKAVANVEGPIADAITGLDVANQELIDTALVELDGTPNKSRLGANATLAVSMAVCRAGAAAKGVQLYTHIADLRGASKLVIPVPFLNVINGGIHAGNGLAMQEFMIAPVGAKSFAEGMMIAAEVFQQLQQVIKEKYGIGATNVGNEGGFAPNIKDGVEALELLAEAIRRAGHGGLVAIAIDAAASEFYKGGRYNLDFKLKAEEAQKSRILTPAQLDKLYLEYVDSYPVVLLEDPHHESGFKLFAGLTSRIGKKVEVVGDDIYVTNPRRLRMGIRKKAGNAVLIKLNQIGTVSETLETVGIAGSAGWGVFGSHRSGETEDTFLADFAVGARLGHLKAGSSRSERTAKYNRLAEIELETHALYSGRNFRLLRAD